MQVSSIASPRSETEDADYANLIDHTRSVRGGPPFTTDAADLYAVFLDALPPARRQHYECRTCRHFVDRFGGLVTIGADGIASSLLWSEKLPGFFADAVRALRKAVDRARVNGVFLSSDVDWGLPVNKSPKSPDGLWRHMAILPSAEMVHRPGPLLTSAQVAAEKGQDYGTLSRGLTEFPVELVRQAHTLLTTGALYRSEKCVTVAKWLLDLHEAREAATHKAARENLVWRAVATAPPGFPHVRSTMIATLLEDLAAGKDFADIKRSFDAKMSPIQYQRPQAAPTDGQLAAAESVVAKLGASGALARRFATLEDVLPHALWTPKAPKEVPASDSVFGHLKGKSAAAPGTVDVPAQPMTWEKFARTVLPTADKLELLVPQGHGPFFAFVTTTNPGAPPILQWDSEGARNPVSWYLYNGGSLAGVWNLVPGAYVDVASITPQPSEWNGSMVHQGAGAFFILKGARDMLPARAGIGLFPEILRSEFHGIRAAIEAYSRSKTLDGAEAASACGIAVQKSGNAWGVVVRVATGSVRVSYRIDRWE